MRYNVIVSTETNIGYLDNTIATDLKLRDAIKTAKQNADEDNRVYITWFRSSDGQHGYYNPNGDHAITGKSW